MTDCIVLLIEDDPDLRAACSQALELEDIPVRALSDAESALIEIGSDFAGILVSDVRLPGKSGLDLLSEVRKRDSEIPVILMTGHGDIAMAVSAMRDGAYDFIEKPFAPERLVEAAQRAREKRSLILENRAFRAQVARAEGMEARLIGVSKGSDRLRRQIAAVAASDADVLLLGETGTGKEVAARCLHDFGPRAGRPFVAINCGALPATVVESEIFGHARGAFTGAAQRRVGKFEAANGGTVFLDEIESMPLDVQVKLLRVLQERVVEPLGENRQVPIDVRIVAATKADLKDEVAAGRFREDLLYRLDVVTIQIPPLRDRIEDVPVLFEHFVTACAKRRHMEAPSPDAANLISLQAETWPGNIRELRNRAERYTLGLDDMPDDPAGNRPKSLPQRLEAVERAEIIAALRRYKGSVKQTHTALGIGRKTLYEKFQKHGIDQTQFKDD